MKYLKEAIPYVLIFVFVVLLRTFVITPVIVSGDSMNTTLKDGQYLLLKKYDKTYSRYEVIVFNYDNSKLVKRIIGLPGEHIAYKDGKLYINGEMVEDQFANQTVDFDLKYLGYDTIPEGYYFVLGDNRKYSSDSRIIGLISEDMIEGTTNFRFFPLGKFE